MTQQTVLPLVNHLVKLTTKLDGEKGEGLKFSWTHYRGKPQFGVRWRTPVLQHDKGISMPPADAPQVVLKSGHGAAFDRKGLVVGLILPPDTAEVVSFKVSAMDILDDAVDQGVPLPRELIAEAFADRPTKTREAIVGRLAGFKRKGRPPHDKLRGQRLKFEVLYRVLALREGLEAAKGVVSQRHHIQVRRLEQLIGDVQSEIKSARFFAGSQGMDQAVRERIFSAEGRSSCRRRRRSRWMRSSRTRMARPSSSGCPSPRSETVDRRGEASRRPT